MVQQLGQLPMGWLLTALIIFVVTTGFSVGRIRAERYLVSGRHKFHSRGNYHGYYVAMWGLLPTLFIASAYILFSRAAVVGIREGGWIRVAGQRVAGGLPPIFQG